MKEIVLTPEQAINVRSLDAELRDVVGIGYIGLSTRLSDVIVFFEDDTTSELVRQAADVVANHDASILTAEQEAEIAREQALATARNRYPDALDPALFDSSPVDVQALAERLAWLEQEIRDLRDL